MDAPILLGTCSWNYESWVGLVYTSPKRRAVEYLAEYAEKYPTAEIDSWYYKIPTPSEAKQYAEVTPPGFLFTCKVVQDITVPFLREQGKLKTRNKSDRRSLQANPSFLSVDAFHRYCEGIQPLLPKLALIMLEFEYLNREKMESLGRFLDLLGAFLGKINRPCRIGVEIRNKNYLTQEYFSFLKDQDVEHVFSEKQYMPAVYEIYPKFKDLLGQYLIVRLLGGDREAIEKKTQGQWNRLIEEKPDKDKIVRMSLDAKYGGRTVILNVNNHYEGSAPLTIASLSRLIAQMEGSF
ncbi:MAG: DUF72 domain-containing protein [Spirochaetales bacterium]